MIDLNLSAQDTRDLFIGITGGLIVAALLALIAVFRKFGAKGFLHLRRSVAKFELQLVENLPDENSAIIARTIYNNTFLVCQFVLITALAATVSFVVGNSGSKGEVAIGFFLGAFNGIVAPFIMITMRLNELTMRAVTGRERLTDELRAKLERLS